MQHRFSTMKLTRVALAVVVLSTLSACTKGAGSSDRSAAPPPTPASLQPVRLAGPAVVTASYTDAEAAAIVTAIGTVTKNLTLASGLSKREIAEAYLNAVKAAIPQIADGGIVSAGNGVWLRLKDGSPIALVTDARPTADAGTPDPTSTPWNPPGATGSNSFRRKMKEYAARGFQAMVPSATAATGKKYVLPGNNKAGLFEVSNLAPNAAREITSMLSAAKYQISGATEPTMTALRDTVKDFGLLWFSSHGVNFVDPLGIERFGVASGEPADKPCALAADICLINRDDINAGRASRQVLAASGKAHILIHAGWVVKYWKLAKNAFVFLDACESMKTTFAAQEFLDALHSVGANTIFGWTESVEPGFAEKASVFLFDRLLGASKFTPPTPKQRPFAAVEVFKAMESTNRVYDATWGAFLKVEQFGEAESILVPSIQNIVMSEGTHLINLFGEFGDTPGVVKVNGIPLNATWGHTNITAEIPLNGISSSGDVTATVFTDTKSNAVPLTEWIGTFHGRHRFTGLMGAPGPYWDFDCTKLRLRLDVHKFRRKPEEAPAAGYFDEAHGYSEEIVFDNVAPDSVCSHSDGGQGVKVTSTPDTTTTTTISFTGPTSPVSWGDNQNLPGSNWFVGVGSMFPNTYEFQLFVNSRGTSMTPMHVHVRIEKRNEPPVEQDMDTQYGQPSIGSLGTELKKKKYRLDNTSFSLPQTTDSLSLPVGSQGEVDMKFDATSTTIPKPDTPA